MIEWLQANWEALTGVAALSFTTIGGITFKSIKNILINNGNKISQSTEKGLNGVKKDLQDNLEQIVKEIVKTEIIPVMKEIIDINANNSKLTLKCDLTRFQALLDIEEDETKKALYTSIIKEINEKLNV